MKNLQSVNRFLSRAAKNMKRSAIREILKLLQRPGMISFAGGLPAPETFPVQDLKQIAVEVLENDGDAALQYSTTEGDTRLRQLLVERHNRQGFSITTDNLIITTGSQQALDLIGRIFIEQDDFVLCGLPSYLGGINAFQSYGARLKGIPLDDNGMIPGEIEKTASTLKQLGRKIKFIYIVPDFQNPAGITVPEQRRLEIIELAEKYDFLIVEDSPYRDIRFEGEHQKSMFQLDKYGRVITLCTFSKIFAPGFRVGWVVSQPYILERIVMAKQTADLCTSAFVQKILAVYMGKGLLEKNLPGTIKLYRHRRDVMLESFRKHMPREVKWTEPHGGLFVFVTLPPGIDTDRILMKAIENNVAFVAGSTFFCNDSGHNTMRINFSYSSDKEIELGVERLAAVIGMELRNQ
jgi:2-aminoadipate transaminase